jgi:hypothetical protein
MIRSVVAVLLVGLIAACGDSAAPAAQEPAEPVAATPAAGETPTAPADPSKPFGQGRFAPRDECARLPGAAQFRNRLAEAIRLRDGGAIAAMASADVKLDFGGGAGRQALKSRLAGPGAELWQDLERLLPLGCAARGDDELSLPWLWNQDLGQADPFTALLVTGEDEPVRAGAARSAKKIATVSWDLVEAVNMQPDQAFNAVRLADGRSGYIATDKLRSVIDYRLIAERRDGRWQIVALIAGD